MWPSARTSRAHCRPCAPSPLRRAEGITTCLCCHLSRPVPRRLGHRPPPTPGWSGLPGLESNLTAGPAPAGRSKQTVGLPACGELAVSALQGSRKARGTGPGVGTTRAEHHVTNQTLTSSEEQEKFRANNPDRRPRAAVPVGAGPGPSAQCGHRTAACRQWTLRGPDSPLVLSCDLLNSQPWPSPAQAETAGSPEAFTPRKAPRRGPCIE